MNTVSFNNTALQFTSPHYDRRSTLKRVVDFIISVFKQIRYSLTVLYHRFHSKPQLCGQKIEWKKESEGLFVLLHGLRNDPAAWFSQRALLKQHDNIDVFAPLVPKRGMCSLEEAASPILPSLLDYAQQHPNTPIVLIGVSNGSRIATWLEVQMRAKEPQTPIKVSTIAGVHLGSSRMDLLNKLGLDKFFYPKVLGVELKYKSEPATKLLDQVKAPLPPNCAPRSYEFYGTLDDFAVPNLDSSLPTLNKGEELIALAQESHDSIVTAVAKRQIDSCIQWAKSVNHS